MRRLASSFIKRGLLVAGGLFVLGTGAHAQRWESGYGDPTKEETARNGVRQVTEGGYVSVGSTKFAVAPFAEDIYVVRTDNHGVLAWSATYNIGDIDVATDIEEVRGAGGVSNGFIITGYTNHRAGSSCGNSYDIFLVRIDRCGNVLWQRTYGATTSDEYGWDVIEAAVGNPVQGTNPGDFVVAGWQGNTPTRDGYLLRVTAAGAPIWGNLYRGPVNDRDDYFYSLDEATTIGAGEIVAAGSTTSYRPGVDQDGWLVRVNGNNGVVLIGTAHGGAGSSEEFRSVQELNTGGNAGHIVTIGQTTTANALNRDVYLLETTSALSFIANRLLGFNAYDEGFYVREIPATGGGVASNVITTGYLTTQWSLGSEDAFLQEFQTGSLAPVGNTFTYGGVNNDRGWSVEPVPLLLGSPCFTSGFIVAGFTQRPAVAPADPLQLYMFKTNNTKNTGCEVDFTPPTKILTFDRIPLNPLTASLRIDCTPQITAQTPTWQQVICPLQRDGTNQCPIICP